MLSERTSVHPHCEHGHCQCRAGCSGRKTNIVRVVVNVVKSHRERDREREGISETAARRGYCTAKEKNDAHR